MTAQSGEISLNEMRDRAGRLIYGDDWIESLTDEQYELLRRYAPAPRAVVRTDGTTIYLPHIEPCPTAIRDRLDRALGQQVRMEAQTVTVDSWLQAQGIPFGHAIRRKFDAIMHDAEAEKAVQIRTADAGRRPGPKPEVGPMLAAKMKADLESGRITPDKLRLLPDKELCGNYGGARDSARKARTAVLAEIRGNLSSRKTAV